MIRYSDQVQDLRSEALHGFFVGWPHPPSEDTHLAILKKSDLVELAIDDETGQVVGFINAITDHILSAYLPLLEVLPEWQHRGIGRTLVMRMLARLEGLYMIDLACDPDLEPFYASLGFVPGRRMGLRHYAFQSGRQGRAAEWEA